MFPCSLWMSWRVWVMTARRIHIWIRRISRVDQWDAICMWNINNFPKPPIFISSCIHEGWDRIADHSGTSRFSRGIERESALFIEKNEIIWISVHIRSFFSHSFRFSFDDFTSSTLSLSLYLHLSIMANTTHFRSHHTITHSSTIIRKTARKNKRRKIHSDWAYENSNPWQLVSRSRTIFLPFFIFCWLAYLSWSEKPIHIQCF